MRTETKIDKLEAALRRGDHLSPFEAWVRWGMPNLDETNDARLKLCRDDSICDASDCCSDCMYKTMLRLMGLEPEQAKE